MRSNLPNNRPHRLTQKHAEILSAREQTFSAGENLLGKRRNLLGKRRNILGRRRNVLGKRKKPLQHEKNLFSAGEKTFPQMAKTPISGPLYYLEGLFYRPGEDRFVANLDDRTLKKVWVLYDLGDHFVCGCFGRYFKLFERRFAFAKNVKRLEASLFYQPPKLFFGERLVEIIHLIEVNAVFTKQRRQIAARRSGRFFVNDYLHRSQLSCTRDLGSVAWMRLNQIQRFFIGENP